MNSRMDILIVNGANLNLLGKREIATYGARDFESYLNDLRKEFDNCSIEYFQSNIEGEIVNVVQNYTGDAVIINAGGYTHSSVAIRDAIRYRTDPTGTQKIPIIEVHISNIYARESFRHESLISPVCNGTIVGFGLKGYRLAIMSVLN